MGKQFEELTPDLREWIERQRMFFVATAPRADDGLLNCSPKGMDTFRIISPHEVGYLDLTGSGIETAAHVGENGRIIFMFCAFDGPPKILRLHGTAAYYMRASPEFRDVQGLFPVLPGTRGIVRARLTRISDSCGWAVPRYEFVKQRDTLIRWSESEGPDALANFRAETNARSVDGLPGLSER